MNANMICASSLLVFVCALILTASAERCPLWSAVECPVSWRCIEGQCRPNVSCSDIQCPVSTRCEDGQCVRLTDLRCGRNIAVANDTTRARSIATDCGVAGVCINGRCRTNRCYGRTCPEGHRCLDGVCEKIIDKFCLTSFDCGFGYACTSNKCMLVATSDENVCNCDPGFACIEGKCEANDGCEFVTCSKATRCERGKCVQVEGRKCAGATADCGKGFMCRNARCAVDPCALLQCSGATVCFEGECRIADGMACTDDPSPCPPAYKCFDGRCTKDECLGKICNAGQVCDGGWCLQIEGQLCSSGLRDCGEAFQCVEGKCVDKFEEAFVAP
uniref:Tenascin-X n=1 Tax=Plectus sambesii TaxID=2011161 RepID=A0A914WET7_9BILA